jgi:GNAT superfamily N-acetyltransferase
VATVVRILNEAADYGREKSGHTWAVGQFEEELASGGLLAQAFERGDVYLVRDSDRPVATVTLQWKDELFWPGAPDDAGYVHRLAVTRDAHGRGIGRRIIEWADQQARARGKRFLRLDTGALNEALHRYYGDAGFELKDERVVGRWDVALFERAIPLRTELSGPPPIDRRPPISSGDPTTRSEPA